MHYSKLVELYEKLEKTNKKLEKRDVLAEFYKSCPAAELYKAVHLSMGAVPTEAEIGVADRMIIKALQEAYGVTEDEVVKEFKETGDLGDSAERIAKRRKAHPLARKELTHDFVFDRIARLSGISGEGMVERKIGIIKELLAFAEPSEARYIVRTILGQMRIGVAHGIVRDAIAAAFCQEPKIVEEAWNFTNDFGRVAEMAKEGKVRTELKIFKPIKLQLAESAPSLEDAIKAFEHPALELKLDGFRAEIHKVGDKIRIFSRRLEDVTSQFPEVVEWSKACLKVRECIVEGEILAVDPKTRAPKPFQELSRRIRRKYEIEKMAKEIPVRIDLFECTWVNGESLMKKPLRDRWHTLGKIVRELKGKFQLVEHIETNDLSVAKKFYNDALARGMEGVMVKNMDARYDPGKRVGYWLKVKPIMEPLDLVVVGAEWGEGKRAKWLSSFVLGARDGKGRFVETGKMASGLTEEQLESMTNALKKLIIEEHGKAVKVKPEVVIEVGYQEIQKSPKYASGYALRFPRLLRIRTEEKKPKDANTVADIERLFKQQKVRK